MHKLITLSEKDIELGTEIMDETHQKSFSQLMVFLMVYYKQNKRGAVGRPRKDKDDDEDRDALIYQSPDNPKYRTRDNPYSKNQIDGWYEMHGMEIPADAYKLLSDLP